MGFRCRMRMGRSDFKGEGATRCELQRLSAANCAKTAEPIDMPFVFVLLWVQGSMYYVECTLAPPGEYH